MAAKRLKGDGSWADEIVDLLFHDASPTEMVKMAKSFLDNTLNHPNTDDLLRAQMVCAICWEWGINPSDEIKQLII
jgi:hypothetical protein